MRGKWGWAVAAVMGVVLVSVVAAPRGTDTVADPPAASRPVETSPSPAPSASRSSPASQDKAAAEARARAAAEAKARSAQAARAKAAQGAAAAEREWAALSRAEGSTARFEHFQVSVIKLRRSARIEVLARVCVRRLPPDPQGNRTRISWDPWSITGGSRTLEPKSPPADLAHAFPAESTYRVGQCALGWLVFPTAEPVRLITYANGVGEEAIWDGTDVTAPPETNVAPPKPAPKEDEPEPLDEPATDYANCKELNGDYPHGVGRPNATDKTKNGSPPVTDFEKNQTLYDANRESDGDKDGVACEKQ